MTMWRTISIAPDYEVSETGQIRRIRTQSGKSISKLRTIDSHQKYDRITLHINGTRKRLSIHVLVCTAWHGPKPGPAHQVNHKDGNKRNNNQDNLEWVTGRENQLHSYQVLGTIPGCRGKPSPIKGKKCRYHNGTRYYMEST